MSSFYNTDNPDSLEVLLQKARAVNTINKETLAHISNSCEVHQTTIEPSTNQPSVKKRRTQTNDNHQDTSPNTPINDIIEAWRYYGEHPQKEKIIFDDFIKVNFSTFDDLIRLVDEYNSLLEKYELTLKDVKESRLAVEVVLRNVEILQVAIGEVHTLILDASLDHTSIPKGCVDVTNKKSRIKSFTNIEALKCKLTLRKQKNKVRSIETFDANGKQYILSAGCVWDLSNNKVAVRHSIPTDPIFFKDGVQMCAKFYMKKFEIWDVSDGTKVFQLCNDDIRDHGEINALVVYEKCEKDGNPKDDNIYLVAGCDCGTILFWDLDDFEMDRIDGLEKIDSLYVFYRDSNPYMVCIRRVFRWGLSGDPIEVWDLKRKIIIASFDVPEETVPEDDAFVSSIVTKHNDEEILIVLGESGRIHMWNLQNEEHKGSFKVYDYFYECNKKFFEVLECGGKSYLACPGDEATVIIWDIEDKKKIVTLSTEAKVTAMRVFMNEDKPCLITGDDEGNIKLWME